MSMFEKAKASPVTTKAAPKKGDKAVFAIAGMEAFAAVKAVEKALKAVSSTLEQGVKAQMAVKFVEIGMKKGSRPDSFKGEEGQGSASCELRCRTSTSVLTVEEQSLLEEHKIPVVTLDTVVETFIINPAYADNSDLLERVSKALEGIEGMPADFILHQSQKKVCADEASMNAVFALKDKAVVAALLPLVSTLAVKPTITSEKAAFDLVVDMLGLNTPPTAKATAKAKA
jgi:hypothetical protein